MINIKRLSAVLIGACLTLSSMFSQDLPDNDAFTHRWQGKGIKLGLSLANVTNETGISTDANWMVAFGPSVSGYLTYQISPRFAFQPEVVFSQRGYQRGLDKTMFNQALSVSASALPDYLNLNTFMTYTFNKRLHVFAGPSLGTNLNGQVSGQDEHEGESEEEFEQELEEEFEDENGNGLQLHSAGIVFGTEYSLGRIGLSPRYNLNLFLRNNPTFGIKNHVFQILLWYEF